jgi:hypothetical protein
MNDTIVVKNTCCYCSKKFSRKSYYDRHFLICELFNKTAKERKVEVEEYQDTPTVRKLYEIIMEMSVKYKKMEEKVEELSKQIENKNKKINIIDWLNATYKNCEPFDKWYCNIKVERKHLEAVFDCDYVYGSLQVLKDHLSGYDKNIPIRAYELKDNVLYTGVSDTTVDRGDTTVVWCEMKNILFDKMMNFIHKQLLHEFVTWQNENKHRIEEDTYTITYVTNLKKFNGGNYTREQIYGKIHRELYKHLKSNMSVIQCDVVI